MNFIVTKFGGTSVSSRSTWDNIAAITRQHIKQGVKPVIVCSALTQATNQLDQAATLAVNNQYGPILSMLTRGYQSLAEQLDVPFSLLEKDFEHIKRLLQGIALLKEITPKTKALLLSHGEVMITRLGHAFLNTLGVSCMWFDIKEALQAHIPKRGTVDYLKARVEPIIQPDLIRRFQKINEHAIITQGFIAASPTGETVLLSRGGSDTSGALLAAALDAASCEIWTDVPGIYTANPHRLPNARLLTSLHYDEAQEISTMGAKVLHPHAIPPVSKFNIPMHIKCTQHPDHFGTLISNNHKDDALPIKSIQVKEGLCLISIDTSSMWQQVGFLADVFTIFKEHGISIDLLSSSECSITVSLDNAAFMTDPEALSLLLNDLNPFGSVSFIEKCAAISVIGHRIRTIIPELGETLKLFKEHPIFLVSMAANDLNLTFVVEHQQAESLAKKLHELLIEQQPIQGGYAKSWQEEFGLQECAK